MRAGVHPVPLVVDHRTPVADELRGQLAPSRSREELCVLDLLNDDQGFLLGSGPRLVVAREREEDDEAEQHREPGREHSEDACRAIAVLEVAAFGSASAHEQQRRHCHPATAAVMRIAQTMFMADAER